VPDFTWLCSTYRRSRRLAATPVRTPAARWLVWLLLVGGCGRPAHLLWEAAPLHREPDGTVEAGLVVGPLLAPVGPAIQVQYQGQRVTVQLKAIGPDKARFAATFPDGTVEQLEVGLAETKELFPDGQTVGVRIRVYEKRQ
jgi:hypothetical protein